MKNINYAAAFTADARPVVYVGVNYDSNVRTVNEVKCEEMKSGNREVEKTAGEDFAIGVGGKRA